VRARCSTLIEDEMRTASGLVDESAIRRAVRSLHRQRRRLGEGREGPQRGDGRRSEAADERMMREVEGFFGVTSASTTIFDAA
jgi:hypothetical protein